MTGAIQLLVGTRKGAWTYRSDAARQAWEVSGPLFLGQIVNHFVRDPRDGKTMLMAASTGHLDADRQIAAARGNGIERAGHGRRGRGAGAGRTFRRHACRPRLGFCRRKVARAGTDLDVLAVGHSLGEQLAGENVVILVILDEQNSEWLYWMHGLH